MNSERWGQGARMIAGGMGVVAQRLSRLHRMWEDAGSNPASPIPLSPRPPRPPPADSTARAASWARFCALGAAGRPVRRRGHRRRLRPHGLRQPGRRSAASSTDWATATPTGLRRQSAPHGECGERALRRAARIPWQLGQRARAWDGGLVDTPPPLREPRPTRHTPSCAPVPAADSRNRRRRHREALRDVDGARITANRPGRIREDI